MSSAHTAPKRSTLGGAGPKLIGGTLILPILGVLLVSLRLISAGKKSSKRRWDAIWIGLGMLWALPAYITFSYSVYLGVGNHVRALTYSQIFESIRWTWISIFTGLMATLFVKLAIIALLLSVQPPNARTTRAILWGLGAILTTTNVTQVILTLNKCKPLTRLWNPTIPGFCPLQDASAQFSYYQGGINAFADIFLSLFPITIVWNLQASKRVKIEFCALMASGSIPSVAVIVRTTLLKRLSTSKDATYDFGHFMLCATLELWTVLIISSIPPLRPLFLEWFSKASSFTNSRGTGNRTANTMNNTERNPNTQAFNIHGSKAAIKSGIITQTTHINVDVESGSSIGRVSTEATEHHSRTGHY
ncbi:hypothetical protein KVT40_000884 [Elsinoe batatas]|uniref:Rhodopsin domain-containing protein n=1 Tax=Elsinoe batatas TaxID=2601811 RepID=A0A8K0L8K4_9PEZI|nr:hypothetical protein KVT40_000884 [Elsinoe batatas]